MSHDIQLVLSAFRCIKGIKFNKSLYEHRLIAQKLAYVMKTLGYTISSSFSWYLRGPYSHQLAEEMYSIENNQSVNEDFTRIKMFVQEEINDTNKMELIGSLLYLIREGGRSLEKEDDLIFTLCSLKPQFSREEVKSAINKIRVQLHSF